MREDPVTISGETRLAGVLGYPASHSLSPAMHNAAFAASGIDAVFLAFEVAPEHLDSAVAGLRALRLLGASVTMPHKEAIVPLLDGVAGDAQRIGAVNAVAGDDGRLIGHNTDGAGFLRFCRQDARLDPSGARVLILGAGGAAKAVATALSGAGADVVVAARRLDRGEDLARAAGGAAVAWDERGAQKPDLIVNATPVGMGGDGESPYPADSFPDRAVAVDLVYLPERTPFLVAAQAAGLAAHGGLGMLLHQAVLAFELWTGGPAPEQAMAQALAGAVRRSDNR